jgi:hypothetical protein
MIADAELEPSTRRGRAPSRRMLVLLVLLPAIMIRVAVDFGLANLEQLVAMAAGILVLCVIVRRPASSLASLVLLLPFTLLLSSLLYEIGLPGGVARMAALWKELVAVAILLAAWRRGRTHPHVADALDRVGGSFVALGSAYLLVPALFVSEPGSSISVDTRFAAWRLVVLPVVLFLAARRLRLDTDEIRRVLRAVTRLAVVLGVIGVVEFVASDWWNRFLIETIGVNRYRVDVLGSDLVTMGLRADDIRTYGEVAGRDIVRVGGPVVSYLTFAFLLLVVLSLLLERLVRGQVSRMIVIGIGFCGAGLLFTQTRSAIVGGCIVIVAVLRAAPGRPGAKRVQYIIAASAAMLVAVPAIFGAGLADRFTSGDATSDSVHSARIDHAIDVIEEHPMGLGLAMGATTSGREVPDAVISENQVLDVGVQLGVLGMVLFVVQYGLISRTLRRAATHAAPEAQVGALAVRNAMIGLLVPIWYLQPLSVFEVAWMVFALAGAALGAAERGQPDAA